MLVRYCLFKRQLFFGLEQYVLTDVVNKPLIKDIEGWFVYANNISLETYNDLKANLKFGCDSRCDESGEKLFSLVEKPDINVKGKLYKGFEIRDNPKYFKRYYRISARTPNGRVFLIGLVDDLLPFIDVKRYTVETFQPTSLENALSLDRPSINYTHKTNPKRHMPFLDVYIVWLER